MTATTGRGGRGPAGRALGKGAQTRGFGQPRPHLSSRGPGPRSGPDGVGGWGVPSLGSHLTQRVSNRGRRGGDGEGLRVVAAAPEPG